MNYVMLKDVCAINMGQSPDSKSYNDTGDGVPFFQGNADFGARYPVTRKWCSEPTKMAAPNDILISVRAPIGAMNYARENCCIGRGLAALTPDKSKALPEFIFWLLKGKNAELNSKGTGSTFKAISRKVLEEIMIPEISLEKQIEFSEILERVYGVIQARKEELQKLDELIKARFVEMFGDPIKNPKKYPIHQLSEHITSLTSGSRGWAQYCVNDGREWFITIKNVKDCHIITDNMQPVNAPDNAEAKRTKVQEGDLLISITADLGRTGVVTKEIAEHGAYINQHLSCIRVNKEVLNPLFVAHYMESPAGKEQFTAKNQSAVKAGLNFNAINSLKLIVPPMKEQKNFINFVNQVDKSKVKVQKALDETQKLFDSLMQQYFG
ncbi:MAG: restriction endonuclease subunit S [Clostridia bacterium]|uniref:restriction endonuclease subunit S n=1 Tax=Blautia luti TaxID=89014 RepID=UPI001D0313B0|nr:restriction endonuclease subunit S [Blautia luti]MCB5475322.1 restriction endonuclease subunit S [Blautia luti]